MAHPLRVRRPLELPQGVSRCHMTTCTRAGLPIRSGAGRRPDHALAALPTLRRRPVCARAGALPTRAWTTPTSAADGETCPTLAPMSTEHPAPARSFGGVADAYDRGRPGYPPEAAV